MKVGVRLSPRWWRLGSARIYSPGRSGRRARSGRMFKVLAVRLIWWE
jgi:hypothetical protein